jgi:hypothetical protein
MPGYKRFKVLHPHAHHGRAKYLSLRLCSNARDIWNSRSSAADEKLHGKPQAMELHASA